MRKLLIATHGYLADGVKSSLNILCGEKENIRYINAYVDERNIDEDIIAFFKELTPADEGVIFTDIYGGSVNQKFIPFCSQPNVFLIAGFNLGLILEFVFKDEPLTDKIVNELVENSRKHLVFIREIEQKEDDEDAFFAVDA